MNKLNKQWRQKKKDGYFTDETIFNLNAPCGEGIRLRTNHMTWPIAMHF